MTQNDKKPPDQDDRSTYMTEGLSMGLCLGAAVGAAWCGIALATCTSMGMLLGLVIGLSVKKN